ncbi:hypothetical protein HYH03_016510 [Edaphochlamys debaryana]|uniref:Uncharacterized protein n=1 Tax=Edaphochlamys debaryana TaxID=47281 RepID=A0A835XIZ9_9CHLO|nr:hypothetical protein HYH03_016510 [Edaphochlamys debaryana]|eukprot:KAG2484681.1 hypothetical protein HYH03_016510 [Edaphochlamys debaryana]
MGKSLLKTAAAGALLGVSTYVGTDVLGEYTTYCALRNLGLAYAAKDEQLEAQIGKPYDDGPWYNASIGFTQSGHIAAVTFPLKGSRQITDVTVRAVRRPGLTGALLYNLTGGEWKVLDCNAMAPQPGGMVKPRSLLPQQAVPKVVDGKIQGECEECNTKAAGARGQGASAPAAAAAAATSPAPSASSPETGAGAGAASAAGTGGGGGEAAAAAPRKKRFYFF